MNPGRAEPIPFRSASEREGLWVGTIDIAGGASAALRWLVHDRNIDTPRAAFLFVACGLFVLAGLGLIYAFIKDLRPGRLTIAIGPIKIEYEQGLPPPEGDQHSCRSEQWGRSRYGHD